MATLQTGSPSQLIISALEEVRVWGARAVCREVCSATRHVSGVSRPWSRDVKRYRSEREYRPEALRQGFYLSLFILTKRNCADFRMEKRDLHAPQAAAVLYCAVKRCLQVPCTELAVRACGHLPFGSSHPAGGAQVTRCFPGAPLLEGALGPPAHVCCQFSRAGRGAPLLPTDPWTGGKSRHGAWHFPYQRACWRGRCHWRRVRSSDARPGPNNER